MVAHGTIAFDTLTTSDQVNTGTEKSLDTSYLYNGSIKAYGHHSGDSPTTASMNDSFNIATLTDNGTGDITYTWTNAFNNEYYSASGMSTEDGTIGYVSLYYSRSYTRSAANLRLQGIDNGDSFDDGVFTSFMCVGALA